MHVVYVIFIYMDIRPLTTPLFVPLAYSEYLY